MSLKNCLDCNEGKLTSELVDSTCGHSYCWNCLNKYIKFNINSKIKCPFQSCNNFIRDRVIRQVISGEDIEKYENAALNQNQIFFCLLNKCRNPVSYTESSIQYQCANCSLINCISCKAPHELLKCADFKSKNNFEQRLITQTELRKAETNFDKFMANINRNSLLEFEKINVLENDQIFTCICDRQFGIGKGIKLQNCFHYICKECLQNYINQTSQIPIPCPFCVINISDREIKSILSSWDFKIYHRRCKNSVIKHMSNVFHCKTPDCDNFCEIMNDSIVKEFKCTKCKRVNCINCAAVHPGESCKQYQDKNFNKSTKKMLLEKSDCMQCPKCNLLIMKKGGCNWIQCPNCQIELCWIRKMLRWGPNGQDDVSEGCKCMVNNIPCDPKCLAPYCSPHIRAFFSQ